MQTAIPPVIDSPSLGGTIELHGPAVHVAPALATRRDDTIAGLCGVWMIAGLFLDGWAHRNEKPETFFSPWHGILYSGFFASALWMLYVIRRGQQPRVPDPACRSEENPLVGLEAQ